MDTCMGSPRPTLWEVKLLGTHSRSRHNLSIPALVLFDKLSYNVLISNVIVTITFKFISISCIQTCTTELGN